MAYNRRKRKVKKNIPEAVAHIHSTYNNTIVTISDKEGNAISWSSAGRIGYKGSKKKTPFAAGLTSEAAAAAAVEAGVKKVDVFVKGLGPGREMQLDHFKLQDLKLQALQMKHQFLTMDVVHQKDQETNKGKERVL